MVGVTKGFLKYCPPAAALLEVGTEKRGCPRCGKVGIELTFSRTNAKSRWRGSSLMVRSWLDCSPERGRFWRCDPAIMF